MNVKTQLFSTARRFRDDEAGTASIESLFWIPVFVFFLVLIIDVSFIIFGKAQMLRVVQDGNRAYSFRLLPDNAATEAYIEQALLVYSTRAEATTGFLDDDETITTTVTVPASDFMIVGTIPAFADTMISVTANHFQEQ